MLRILRRLVPWIVACAAVSGSAFGAWLSPCAAAHLIASWKHDGLWRTAAIEDLPKSVDGHRVRYVGKLRAGGRIFKIYYDQNSDPDTEAHQGHSDVVITTASGKFLGLYDIDTAEPVRAVGADILFDWMKNLPPKIKKTPDDLRIHFGSDGPPDKVHVGGDFFYFSTPAEYRKYAPTEKPWPPRGPRVANYCRH